MKFLKKQLYSQCVNYLQNRIQRILDAMKNLENDLENETKSSAGDKYETGREMINLEWNKLSSQLQQFKILETTLKKTNIAPCYAQAQLGSVVKTNTATYFIAIPAGQISLQNKKYFAIGAGSPVAQLLLHKKAGDSFRFNGKTHSILEVF